MRKKLTVILPLYLASLVLLAFSVFPHHHHASFICFNTVHDLSAEHPHHHTHPEIPEKGCNIQYLFQADDIKTFSDTPVSFAPFCCTLTERLELSYTEQAADFRPDAADDALRQLLFSSPEFTRGPPSLS